MCTDAGSLADPDLDRGLVALADDHSLVKLQLIEPAYHQARVAVDGPLGQPFLDHRHRQHGVPVDDVRREDRQRIQIDRAAKYGFQLAFGRHLRPRRRRRSCG